MSQQPLETDRGDPHQIRTRPVSHVNSRVECLREWLYSHQRAVIGALLFLLVLGTFWGALSCGFVDFDDPTTVYQAPEVSHGLSWAGFRWAFSHTFVGHWVPLTTLSHMLDCQLYGLDPRGHHLTNVLLHALTTVLLFLLLRRMTGAVWRSALVAALWAVHPLRVESVVWVSERKDVLSGVFFLLTLGAYMSYVHRPSLCRYLVVMLWFALGLLCKSMLVTLPFILLLMDWWPLQRWRETEMGGKNSISPRYIKYSFVARAILEKLPLILMSVAVSVIQLRAAKEMLLPLDKLSLAVRLGNASVSYVAYIKQIFWPVGLAVFYPHPEGNLSAFAVATSTFVLLFVFTLIVWKRGWALFGWIWYVVMLIPVIGIVQSTTVARADRYTYLPQIGIYIILVWVAAQLSAALRLPRTVILCVAGVTILAFGWGTYAETQYWKNSIALYQRALEVTENNWFVHDKLAVTLLANPASLEDAINQCNEANRIKPDNGITRNILAIAHYRLGIRLSKAPGRLSEAISEYKRSLQFNSGLAEVHFNLGNTLKMLPERKAEGIDEFKAAIQIDPKFVLARYNLANALAADPLRSSEAISAYQALLTIDPKYAEAHNNFGVLLAKLERFSEACDQFREAIRLKPDYREARNNLAKAYADLQKSETK